MTEPICNDPVSDILNYFIAGLRAAYDPTSACPPPDLTEIPMVRFFAGEVAPQSAFDAITNDPGCDVPFIWLRVASRYRSREFPAPVTGQVDCGMMGVVAVELGVAWCAITDQYPTPEQYAAEAETSLDHSWRLEKALCSATSKLKADNHLTSLDTIAPYGPEGGILSWSTTSFVSFT